MRTGCCALIALLATGCQTSTVLVRGKVFADHAPDSAPLANAEITFVDPNEGTVLAVVESEIDGAFAVEVPTGVSLVAEVRGQGLHTATFPGVAGFSSVLDIEDHTLYGVSKAEIDELRDRYAGCPGADSDGAIVYGEVRIFGLQDPLTGGSPTTNAGRVDVWSEKGDTWTGCYLDEEGVAHDPLADRTGTTGQFAVFGVGAGLHEVDVRYEFTTDYWLGSAYPGWVPRGDEQIVVPMWPAWVQWQL